MTLKESGPHSDRYVITSLKTDSKPQIFLLTSIQTPTKYNEKVIRILDVIDESILILRNQQSSAFPFTWIGPYTFDLTFLNELPLVSNPAELFLRHKQWCLDPPSYHLWHRLILSNHIIPIVHYICSHKIIKRDPKQKSSSSTDVEQADKDMGNRGYYPHSQVFSFSTTFTTIQVRCMFLLTSHTNIQGLLDLQRILKPKSIKGDVLVSPSSHLASTLLPEFKHLALPNKLFVPQRVDKPTYSILATTPSKNRALAAHPPLIQCQVEYLAFMRYRESRSIFDDLLHTFSPWARSTIPLCYYQYQPALKVCTLTHETLGNHVRGGILLDKEGGTGKRTAVARYLLEKTRDPIHTCRHTLLIASEGDLLAWRHEFGLKPYQTHLYVRTIHSILSLQKEWKTISDLAPSSMQFVWMISPRVLYTLHKWFKQNDLNLHSQTSVEEDHSHPIQMSEIQLFQSTHCRRVLVDVGSMLVSQQAIFQKIDELIPDTAYRWMVGSNVHAFAIVKKLIPVYAFLGLFRLSESTLSYLDFQSFFLTMVKCSSKLSWNSLQNQVESGMSEEQYDQVKQFQHLQFLLLNRLVCFMDPTLYASETQDSEHTTNKQEKEVELSIAMTSKITSSSTSSSSSSSTFYADLRRPSPTVFEKFIWFKTQAENEAYMDILTFLNLKWTDTQKVFPNPKSISIPVSIPHSSFSSTGLVPKIVTGLAKKPTPPTLPNEEEEDDQEEKKHNAVAFMKAKRQKLGETFALTCFELFRTWMEMCNGQSLIHVSELHQEQERTKRISKDYYIPSEKRVCPEFDSMHLHYYDPTVECTICQGDEYVRPVLLPCGHAFCWECIHNWLQMSVKCPHCKLTVISDRLGIPGHRDPPLPFFRPPEKSIEEWVDHLQLQNEDPKHVHLRLDVKIRSMSHHIRSIQHSSNIIIISHFDHVLQHVKEEAKGDSRLEFIHGKKVMNPSNKQGIVFDRSLEECEHAPTGPIQVLLWTVQTRLPQFVINEAKEIWMMEPPLHLESFLSWHHVWIPSLFNHRVKTRKFKLQVYVMMYRDTMESFLWKQFQAQYPTWDSIRKQPSMLTYSRHEFEESTQSDKVIQPLLKRYFDLIKPHNAVPVSLLDIMNSKQ